MESSVQKEILFDDEYLSIYFDVSTKCIVKFWKKPVSPSAFREKIAKLLLLIIQTRIKYQNMVINLIADCSNLTADIFTKENIDWLEKEVHQIYKMNKITKKAFVASKEIVSNLGIVSYISANNDSENNLIMNIFDNIDEAKKWIAT